MQLKKLGIGIAVRKPFVMNRTGVKRPNVTSNALEIQHSTGKASIYKTAWVIIGLPKIGKSTFASGFDGVLFLCTSAKEVGSLTVPFVLIDSWAKLMEVTDELINNREKYNEYKFIAIDFLDAVWTLCVTAVCDKLGVSHTSEAAYGKGVDTVDTYFKRWITTLIASDYSILFVSHVNQKDVIVSGGTVTKTICSLPVRARMIVFPLVNVIGCMEYKTVQVPNPTGKIALVRKRIISFEGNEYVEAGDRDGVLPKELVLLNDPKANFELIKDYYEGRRVKK